VRQGLAAVLSQTVKRHSHALFERLVKISYGGTRKDTDEAIGGSGDSGIDGIINEDSLGLDVVYILAKRWANSATRPEVQELAGALLGQGARKASSSRRRTSAKGRRSMPPTSTARSC